MGNIFKADGLIKNYYSGGNSVLFSILLIMVVMNLSSGHFIKDTQKAIGSSVYIRKVRDEGNGRRNNLGIFSENGLKKAAQSQKRMQENR